MFVCCHSYFSLYLITNALQHYLCAKTSPHTHLKICHSTIRLIETSMKPQGRHEECITTVRSMPSRKKGIVSKQRNCLNTRRLFQFLQINTNLRKYLHFKDVSDLQKLKSFKLTLEQKTQVTNSELKTFSLRFFTIVLMMKFDF